MSQLGYIDISAVKAATTLEQILKHYGILASLKPSGASLRGICPIHKGDDPKQFSVSLEKGLWKCFSECQHGGNHLDFVMRMEDCSSQAAAWKLNEWFGLGLEGKTTAKPRPQRNSSKPVSHAEPLQETSSTPTPAPTEDLVTETGENRPLGFALENLDREHPYLAERGLDAATIAEFGVGYCAKGIMAGRIAIPIHNSQGQLVANAGRWPGEPPEGKEKYRLPGKFLKTLEVFNFHRAVQEPGETPLIIAEGFFGVMHLWQQGFRRAVALMGWSMSQRQEEMIASMVNPSSRIVFMLDGDEAGTGARKGIASRLAEYAFVKVFRWPTSLIQPDELTSEHLLSLRE